ncbi:unnamed protein product [Pleuronectes platessa]|uniref:Uncharacterized protein n=1 Tax=Pleuronectes platessa TaxID=8262 RepID=A0A9N7TMJ1_PLEPL|nr:unnamed protein product [Pleuronectes platessa]
MARQRRHLPGTRVSLISRPFALPPQDSQSVSSPVGAPVPPHADLFTDHNQTADDWPKVRLSVYAVSRSMHVRTEPGEPRGWALGESEQGSGELQWSGIINKNTTVWGPPTKRQPTRTATLPMVLMFLPLSPGGTEGQVCLNEGRIQRLSRCDSERARQKKRDICFSSRWENSPDPQSGKMRGHQQKWKCAYFGGPVPHSHTFGAHIKRRWRMQRTHSCDRPTLPQSGSLIAKAN